MKDRKTRTGTITGKTADFRRGANSSFKFGFLCCMW